MSTIEPSTASLLSAALWQQTSDSGPTSASEAMESSFSDVEISQWAPTIAIADTFSDAAASVAIVTLSAGSLDGLASILLQMKAATEDATEASRVGSSQDYTEAIDVRVDSNKTSPNLSVRTWHLQRLSRRQWWNHKRVDSRVDSSRS